MKASAINPTLDVIDTILREAEFHKLLGALQGAGLIDTLKGSGPFTLFAPTDEAFESTPLGTIQELQKPANHDKLRKILEYHVVMGRHDAMDLISRSSLTTVNGAALTVLADARGMVVGGVPIIGTDIPCTNGVIHVIGQVLDQRNVTA